jgi:GT2 family glycosyltransferase
MPAVVLLALALQGPKRAPERRKELTVAARPLVTVVIATYNRHARLRRTLASLAAQTVHDFAVVVVDDAGSSPVGAEVLAALTPDIPARVVRMERNGGAGAARNAGIAASSSEFIAFIDDDVDATPGWLGAHLRAMTDSGMASIGPLLPPADWRPLSWNLWEARTLEREYARIARGLYPAGWRQFFTGNAMVRRADLVAAGGFDATFRRAEDIELGVRLEDAGVRFVLTTEAAGWHYARRTFASWRRMAAQYAEADVAIDAKHPRLAWRRVVAAEQSRRHPGLRMARNGILRSKLRAPVVFAAAGAARVLTPLHEAAGLRALSLAYDLEYHAALKAATSHAEPGETSAPLSLTQERT